MNPAIHLLRLPCRALAVAALLALAGCGSRPPAPDWAVNAESAAQRATAAYLEGRQRVQAMEWDKARAEVARTARPDLAARLELMRCAAQVASLEWDDCPGYQALSADAAPAEAAYARYLAGQLQAGDAGLLPEAQRPVAQALTSSPSAVLAAVQGIAEPLPRLVAAGAALRAGQGGPGLLASGVQAASAQGWRRPLMAWLLLQAQAHDKAGEGQQADAVRRRVQLLERSAAAGK